MKYSGLCPCRASTCWQANLGAPGGDFWYYSGSTSTTMTFMNLIKPSADSLLNIDVNYALKLDLPTSTHVPTMDLSVHH